MKFLLVFLTVFSFTPVFSQDMQFIVSAGLASVTVSPEEDNKEELFVFDAMNGNALTVNIINDEIDADWMRSFTIHDSTDNALLDFTFMKNGSYCIKNSSLRSKLVTAREYYIYTTAVPKDPAKAMLVKVARILVCKIKTR